VGTAVTRSSGSLSADRLRARRGAHTRTQHRFLRIRHGGYLSGAVAVKGDVPTLSLRLHGTDGTVIFSDEKKPAPRN